MIVGDEPIVLCVVIADVILTSSVVTDEQEEVFAAGRAAIGAGR